MKRCRKPHSGFTLLELMMVVALIAILISIAIPSLLRSRIAANESSAISAIRSVVIGEVSYQTAVYKDIQGDGIGDFGNLDDLYDPAGDGQPGFIDDALASGFSHGYEFVLVPMDGIPGVPPTYTLNANPVMVPNLSARYFYTDQSGVIRISRNGPADENSLPLH